MDSTDCFYQFSIFLNLFLAKDIEIFLIPSAIRKMYKLWTDHPGGFADGNIQQTLRTDAGFLSITF